MPRLIAPLAVAGLLFAPLPAWAQQATADNHLATVDGEPVHPRDLDAYRAALPEKEQRRLGGSERGRAVLLEELINRRVLAEAARERGLAEEKAVRRAMRRAGRDVLIETLFRRVVQVRVTGARVRQYYRERLVEGGEPVVRLERIQVGNRSDGQTLRAHLEEGVPFGPLARASASQGKETGGWTPLSTLAEPVRKAIAEASVDEVVGPVEAGDGWLLARVRERREGEPPPLSELQGAIRGALERRAIQDVVAELRAEREIRYPEEP